MNYSYIIIFIFHLKTNSNWQKYLKRHQGRGEGFIFLFQYNLNNQLKQSKKQYKTKILNFNKSQNMSSQDQHESEGVNKLPEKQRNKKTYNATEVKNRRITRRMKKIMSKKNVFVNRDNNEKCAICLSECAKNSATLPCSHAFCMDCISNWWATNSTCPYCRNTFSFIYDYRGKRLLQSQIPQNLLLKREDTLKCQSCWADIGEQPMRICYQCRCVYSHKRCMAGWQLKIQMWKCQQCFQHQENEENQELRNKQQRQAKQEGYYRAVHLNSLNMRHSQRIIMQYGQRHK